MHDLLQWALMGTFTDEEWKGTSQVSFPLPYTNGQHPVPHFYPNLRYRYTMYTLAV